MLRNGTVRTGRLATLAVALVLAGAACGVKAADTDGAVRQTGGSTTSPATTAPPTTSPSQNGTFSGSGGAVNLAKAARHTSSIKTGTFTMEMAIKAPMVGSLRFDAQGAYDNAKKRSKVTLDLGDLLGSLGGEGSSETPSKMVVITDGTTAYLDYGTLGKTFGATDEKPWLKFDASKAEGGGLGQAGAGTDPGQFLTYLEHASGGLTNEGTETIDGVETTHLSGTLDLEKMLDEAPASEKEKLEKQLDELGAAGDGLRKIPADAWVDDEGLVRKAKITMSMDFGGLTSEKEEGSSEATIAITISYADFGEPVDIAVPPASETTAVDPSKLGLEGD